MEDDWDLFAVVRSCSSTTTTTATIATAASVDGSFSGKGYSNFEQGCSFSSTMFQDLFEPRSIEGLHGLFTPFSPKSEESSQLGQNLPISPLSVLGGLQDLPSEQQQQQVIKQVPLQKQPLFSVSGSKPSPRSKKRKNHMKKVCHVPAESISSDTWSWRKYGQKPIKGSPYPRGYYRCSTSKGCMARKQVERNRSDPGMFIITYTGEHSHPMPTHRNSLAGSTRPKPAETPTSKSPAPEKLESSREDLEDDDDEDEMALDDDFFAGLEDLTGECLSDHIPTDLEFPWLAKSATAVTTMAAGSGG